VLNGGKQTLTLAGVLGALVIVFGVWNAAPWITSAVAAEQTKRLEERIGRVEVKTDRHADAWAHTGAAEAHAQQRQLLKEHERRIERLEGTLAEIDRKVSRILALMERGALEAVR